MLASQPAWDVGDTLVAVATGADYRIEILSADGHLLRSVRRALPARGATVVDAERWAEANPIRFTQAGGAECRIPVAEMVEKIGYADSLPAIGLVVLAPDGALWVRRWSVSGHDGPIDVFDPTGAYLGTLPSTFPFPLHVRTDGRLLYAEKDSLDIERLAIGEVVRD
jgi:hypothetical protein